MDEEISAGIDYRQFLVLAAALPATSTLGNPAASSQIAGTVPNRR